MELKTKIYLIRHGETEGAHSRQYKGHIDVPLSENGVAQVERLAEYLRRKPDHRDSDADIKAVYCSGLVRAVKSAEVLSQPFGLKPVIHEGLKERNFGEWEGMTFDEIKDRWPDAFDAWAENPLNFSPMGGESTIDVHARAMKALQEIISEHRGDRVMIVAHGGINRVILCELLGIPLENIFRIEQDFAALNEIELWDYPVVNRMNYVV